MSRYQLDQLIRRCAVAARSTRLAMNILREKKLEVIAHLRALASRDISPEIACHGLCKELNLKFNILSLRNRVDFMRWPHYSGDENYPIPHAKLNPIEAYDDIKNLWEADEDSSKEDIDYIALRLEFCNWVADELEKDL